MPTERAHRGRLALTACVATALLLAGCGGGAEDTPAASAPSTGADGASGEPGKDSGKESGKAAGKQPGTGSSATTGAEAPDNGGGSDPSGDVLEVPVAPAATVDSLGELLGDSERPLVTAPLPRAASASGRLVGGFPALLRPAPGSRVDSSSVSPADDRLQVALVGSTALAPGRVLLAYRTRLGRRGLLEQPTPQTAAGAQAAALQRGRSVVTITVTREGARTSYSVVATLHTGGE